MAERGPSVALDLTHVLYDESSWLELALAFVTLSPILLMASYAALAVQTREYVILAMWAGQFANEGFNILLKHVVKQDRPDAHGNGYGFPSSHSQYMGYFAAFLACHMYFTHRFSSTGSTVLDVLWRFIVYSVLYSWAGAVAYSRYHLGYHNEYQIVWGLAIGAIAGVFVYTFAELIPTRRPHSLLGQFKAFLLTNPVSTWFQLRDGWALWSDGGHEDEWVRWRIRWDQQRKRTLSDKRRTD
ncbi:PAP2-domain-containing protein [Amanita rubescens]|nr:PAP2-domain-containing protein [Amanita rubescens]